MITAFQKKVYAAVKKIPRGKVGTYQSVARAIGMPLGARAVGNALNRNPFKDVPCHRVVCQSGHVGGFARGTNTKIRLLEKEGIKVIKNQVSYLHILH